MVQKILHAIIHQKLRFNNGRLFSCLLSLLLFSPHIYASDDQDEAPESDIGISSESALTDSPYDIREIIFKPGKGKPIIDGDITDPFWEQAESFYLDIELYPTRLAPAVVATKGWVVSTTTHVYVAFKAYDPNPKKIRSALRDHDATKEDDYVSIIIDPTGALSKKYEFRVNPHGTLSDVVQDTVSDRYIYDWDTDWDGAAKIDEEGYTVEIAIPAGAIRAPVDYKKQDTKGVVILKRSYPRRVDRTLATFFFFKGATQVTEEKDAADDKQIVNQENVEKTDSGISTGIANSVVSPTPTSNIASTDNTSGSEAKNNVGAEDDAASTKTENTDTVKNEIKNAIETTTSETKGSAPTTVITKNEPGEDSTTETTNINNDGSEENKDDTVITSPPTIQDNASVSTDKTTPSSTAKKKPPLTTEKLTITPYYIFHVDEKRSIGGEFEQVDEHREDEVGFDAEYDFNSAETISITVNPNFTDVEADIARQSINNQFVVFKPEKRRFFKAPTEYYNTLIPTVYTRNIIRPSLGASYLQDNSSSSASAFWVSDRETEVIMPDTFSSDKVELLSDSKSGAFRYRYSKDKKTIGAIGTMRTGDDYHNAVLGVDGLIDLSIDDKLRYQALYSDTKYPERFADDLCEEDDCTTTPTPTDCPLGNCAVNAQVLRTDFGEPLTGHALQLRYKHDGPKSLYWVGYEDIAPDFRADLGFMKRVDIRSLNMAYGKKWYLKTLSDDEGKSRVRGYFIGTHTRSNEENELLENALSVWAEFRGTYQSVLRLGKRYRNRAVNRENQATLDVEGNAPLFDENYWQWYFEVSPFANWTLNLDGRIGETADADNLVLGDMVELKPKLTFQLAHFQMISSVTFRDFETDDQRLYKERLLSITMNYRSDHESSHRLIYLDDLTKRDISRWLGTELAREEEKTLEYTFTYKLKRDWSLLTGVKFEYDYKSDIDDGDITNRELYTKFEKQF